MKIDRVVTFGDSWPAGAELKSGELTFGQIIADHYQCEFINCSVSATSIEHMILQLNKFLEASSNKDTCGIFFLTDIARSIYWNDNQEKELMWKDHNYLKHLYSEQLVNFKANQSLLALQRMCDQYAINDFYINGWTKFPITLKGIDLNKIYQHGKETCLSMFRVFDTDPVDDADFIYCKHNHYIRPNQCHPNQLGHQKIANNLIQWIDNYYENKSKRIIL